MLFYLKKFIGGMLLPLPAVVHSLAENGESPAYRGMAGAAVT